jgi:pyrimidine operon attenuation protein/uracil phosphoribosyltransferase
MSTLPDAEALCERLVSQLKGNIPADTGVVGMVTGGAWLAERVHRALGLATPMGILDVSFYRDDFDRTGLRPQVQPSQIPFDVQGRPILLVDDVLNTGRTVRAAMNELFDYGRPSRIDLAVLVDRGGHELPVAAQYVGAELSVSPALILMLDRSETGALTLRLSDKRRERKAGE